MRSRSGGSPFIYLIILVAAVFLVYSFYSQRADSVKQASLTDIAMQIRQGNVKSVRVEGNNLYVELGDGEAGRGGAGFDLRPPVAQPDIEHRQF